MTKLYLTMMFLTPDVSQEIWQAPLFEHCNKTRKLTKIALSSSCHNFFQAIHFLRDVKYSIRLAISSQKFFKHVLNLDVESWFLI